MQFGALFVVISLFTVIKASPSSLKYGNNIDNSINQFKGLKYKLCGRSKRSQAIRISKLDVYPMPIPVPGRVLLQLDANVTKVLPNNVNVKLRLHKQVFGYKVLIPGCLDEKMNLDMNTRPNKKGFCTYRDVPVCFLSGSLFGCPVFKRQYSIHNVMHLPDPGERNRILMAGDYSATIRIHDPTTKELFMCLKTDFSIANSRR